MLITISFVLPISCENHSEWPKNLLMYMLTCLAIIHLSALELSSDNCKNNFGTLKYCYAKTI